MELLLLSKDEMKKLRDDRERHELEELRASLRIASLKDAEERFQMIEQSCEIALHNAEEAYVTFAADEFDDWDTAQDKDEKIERIEHAHDRCIALWENQIRRLNWEARQAQKQTL